MAAQGGIIAQGVQVYNVHQPAPDRELSRCGHDDVAQTYQHLADIPAIADALALVIHYMALNTAQQACGCPLHYSDKLLKVLCRFWNIDVKLENAKSITRPKL